LLDVRPTDVALRMIGISKRFPGVQALSNVDLTVWPGQVHAVVGENGAGKSTLMKILAGEQRPDEGTVELFGEQVEFSTPRDAVHRGIGMVHQELTLVPSLSVSENVLLGSLPRRGGVVRWKEAHRRTTEVLAGLGVSIDPRKSVSDLSVSQSQLVEIARVYAKGPRVLVMDEPTSSLGEHETQRLFQAVRILRGKGVAVIYISHRLREVVEIADHVTVLRDGRCTGSRPTAGLGTNEMIKLMVGRDLTEVFPKTPAEIGEPILRVEGLRSDGVFEDISFEVKAGEILGLAGLIGAGRTEVARALFGLDPSDGHVTVDGVEYSRRGPSAALAAGLAYVPEDRKADGIIASMCTRENLTLAVLDKVCTRGVVRNGADRKLAGEFVRRLDVSPPQLSTSVNSLSGGNQQKVVIGKWLASEPKVLILDEPTRGVDVGAKADIHQIIGSLAAAGTAIVLISSELQEVLAVSDRVLVMHQGRITAEFGRADFSEQAVMAAATGEPAHA